MVTFDKKEIANCKAQYELICNRKLVQITEKGFWDYHQARTSIYHGVCLDIDDTLTFNCLTERRAIVEVLATLTKRNVIICFITGRGKTKAFEFLLQLKEAVCQYDSEIRERQFGRWYCITNNGVHTDDGLLLRGPLNYYYGLAFRKNKRITNKEAKRLNENRINFFKISLAALKQTKVDASDVTARKAILGILDSVRDYLLIYINFELQSRAENEDVLYVVNKEDCKLFDIFAMAKKNLCFMYNSLFGIIDANYIKDIEIFLEKSVLPAAQRANESIKRLEMEFNYNKAFRVWREIDSFYENVIIYRNELI